MNKAELIDAIAIESGLSKADAKRAVEGFIGTTTNALKKGERVALVGFGTFIAADRAARKAERARVRKIVKFEQQLRAAGYKVDEDEDDVELKQAIARAEAAIKKTFGPYEV